MATLSGLLNRNTPESLDEAALVAEKETNGEPTGAAQPVTPTWFAKLTFGVKLSRTNRSPWGAGEPDLVVTVTV